MWVACWNCGQDIWLETQKTCRNCDAPAHRCADCVNYDSAGPTCQALNIDLNANEAVAPSRLSLSLSCTAYEISQAALNAGHAHVGEPHHPVANPSAAKPAAAPSSAPPARPVPREPVLAADDKDLITIRREPALKHPAHPVIIAHRGESSGAPENTIPAIEGALASGASGIEFDIHLTQDGIPVVIHDAAVDRCSNGKGLVTQMTLDQIKALDAGSWFAEPYQGERIPTLDEAIAAIPPPTFMVLHLRDHENESDRCERAVVDAIARHDSRKRTVITHHTRHGLQRLREMDPKLRLCWIPYGAEPGDEYVDDAYYMGCRFLQPKISDVTESFVKYAHEKDMWINVFWADEIEDMERMIALKVDGIITNYPRRLKELLKG
ncbi:MAG: glycerophosphodiester phosphodiesterase [Armatimonadota bacterium]